MRAGEALEADMCPVRGSAPCRFLWEGTVVFSRAGGVFSLLQRLPPNVC